MAGRLYALGCRSSIAMDYSRRFSQRLQETLQRNAERNNMPRACLALFAAANVLGKGFVHGVMPYIYVEKFDPVYLKELGLSAEGAEQSPDVFVRVPLFHEAVFKQQWFAMVFLPPTFCRCGSTCRHFRTGICSGR